MLDDQHISLDIETCGEVVLSIGACYFNPRTGAADEPLYVVPSIKEQLTVGLKPYADGLLWTRGALQAQQSAFEAFSAFRNFYEDNRDAWTWAYSTSFDLPVIQRAMLACGMRVPWNWRRTMDGRTLWQLACATDPAMADVEKADNPFAHHAPEDAREQARWYARYLSAFEIGALAKRRKEKP